MSRALGRTASTVGFSERTLRRYVNEGMLRARQVGRQTELPPSEERYLRSHRELLATLRGALRTERNVRLAVLFGSLATGDEWEGSDIDLLVALQHERSRTLASLRRRLQHVVDRPVHIVQLGDAEQSPSLLADILADGRVIVDRDGVWPRLVTARESIQELAAREDSELMARAARSISDARERAGRVDPDALRGRELAS